MAKPQVTITLGRSGQRVVKDSWGDTNGGRANAPMLSGSKRTSSESFGSAADRSFNYSKRMRDDVSTSSYGCSKDINDSSIDPRDLRMKLMRKRIARQAELENEERKKIELHEKVSRAIQSVESPDRSLPRNIPVSRRAAEPQQMNSMRSSYDSWTSNGVRARSPVRISASSSGISTPRSGIDELPRVSSLRPIDASGTGRGLMGGPSDPSRPKVPMPTTSRGPVGTGKMVTGIPPATGGVPRPAYLDIQPLTVGSLLHSLGLSKYSVLFQAEEIDIVALKQMGDSDLKELGIPMGPRKKILSALQARMKHAAAQAHSNHVQ